MKAKNHRKHPGRAPKGTLRSAPRCFKPCDDIESLLVKEVGNTSKSATQIIEEAIAMYLGKNSKKIRTGRFAYLFLEDK